MEYNTGPCWDRFLGIHFLNWHIVDFNYSHWKSSISHWKDWCWSWNSNTLATWCEELTHWKRAWCWERLKGGGEGDHRGWDGWMASPTRWKWVWVNSVSWWWTGRPGMLQFKGHDWATELNWELIYSIVLVSGVQHTDLVFLQIIFHYGLLQDKGCNTLWLQYILAIQLSYT